MPPALFSRTAKIIMLIAALTAVSLASVFLVLAHPHADDFCRGAVPYGQEFAYIQEAYFGYGGRWAATGLAVILSHLDPTHYYALLLAVLNLCHVVAVYVFLRSVFRDYLPCRYICLLAGFLLLMMWAGLPAVDDTVYWLSGIIDYQLSISFVLLLLAGLFRLPASSLQVWRRMATIGLCFLAIFAAGMHEMIAFMLWVVLVVGTAITFRTHQANRWCWLSVLIACSIGLLITGLAPGNAARSATHAHSQDLFVALRYISAYVQGLIRDWVLDVKLLSLTLLFVLHAQMRRYQPAWLCWPGIPWKWIIPSAWLVCVISGFFVPSWAMGGRMPGRALNAIYMVFLFGWFATILVYTRWPSDEAWLAPQPLRAIASSMLIVFAVSMVVTGNTGRGIRDLRYGNVVAWYKALNQRYDLIRDGVHSGQEHLRVRTMLPPPEMFFDRDITADPQHWSNHCYADFFGLKSIALQPEP